MSQSERRPGPGGHVDRRRTDGRRRIYTEALRLFTEQGYEMTTLAQVAESVGMTRSAVLHHYASKEALLTASFDELTTEVLAITRTDSASVALERFAALLWSDRGGALLCSEVNGHATAGVPQAQTLRSAMDRLTRSLAPSGDPGGRIRGRLAVATLVMADVRAAQLGGSKSARREAALHIARDLVEHITPTNRE